MLRLTTLKDCKNNLSEIKKSITQLRDTFSAVFSNHYANRLAPPLTKAVTSQEVKKAEELKSNADPILKGFSDLLTKKKFFEKELKDYDQAALKKSFEKIYSGPGFDDEEAFLLAFYDMAESKNAKEHFEKIKSRLKPDDRKEVEDYFQCLAERQCELKEVNFVALVDGKGIVRGFAIYHLLQQGDQEILHVRQAAMREQSRGYAKVMARYFSDHYPKTIYEANQRKANAVLMKKNLLEEKLLQQTEPVLGYNKEYYLGLRGTNTILNLFLAHHQKNSKKLGLVHFGKFAEAESVTHFFSQTKLNRDLFALQDDNYCKDRLFMLRQKEVDVKKLLDENNKPTVTPHLILPV